MNKYVLLLLATLSCFLMGQTPAEWTDTRSAALLDALARIGAGEEASEDAAAVREAALDPETRSADWQKLCRAYFAMQPFTPRHGSFWAQVIAEAGEKHERAAQRSGECAAEAVAAAYNGEALEIPSLRASLHWLDYIAPGLSETARRPVSDALRVALSKNPPDIARLLGGAREELPEEAPFPAPDAVAAAMQTCLTLGQYAKPGTLAHWLRLSDEMRVFLDGTGILLFDNGALGPAHLESLESLFRAVPGELHGVTAVIVPEGMPLDVGHAALNTPGMLIEVHAQPMDLFSDPREFAPRAGEQAAPLFTLEAAVQLFRAIQFTQFTARPELAMFRDQVLGSAGTRPERYLRRTIPPVAYLENPDDFLPAAAFLWFLHSEKALQMAEDLRRLGQRPPMDTLMLLSDVLSCGGPTTMLFVTDELGRMSSRETALQRQEMEMGPPIVVGVGPGFAPPSDPIPWEGPPPGFAEDAWAMP